MNRGSPLRDIAVVVMTSAYDAGHRLLRMGSGPTNVLSEGLADRLERAGCVVDLIEIEPLPGQWRSELRTGFAVQRAIRAATSAAISAGAFPVLLSGNCNASLGVVAGLQSGGADPGFLWCDAHADFHTPATDMFGSLDCQGLAMLTGRAWQELVTQTGLRPLRDDQVALIGARSIDLAERQALTESEIRQLTVHAFRDDAARTEVIEPLATRCVDGLHLHIDADVLDPSIAPANDYAEPDGLQPHEMTRLIDDVAQRSTVASVSVASYDPCYDPAGVLARELIDLVVAAVRSRQRVL